ncbi:hypothetical protein E8E13_009204 [Curvularia kusanoi]|uniref:Mus7/MMS22 family-domain-containing protein n=1 Tax=Curvularia kusanoi TaxID=90978 RepID=A0A9P4WEG0_CURKU|nr:hypothetical protein E8E13_009204 [Curvularia kusanoi]
MRENAQVSSRKRTKLSPRQRTSPRDQLRVPKSAKKRKLDGPRPQDLATPARTLDNSPVPLDIWSLPPDSPPFTSSPAKNKYVSKPVFTKNEHSLPTPSNSSTINDEPHRSHESESDTVSRNVQRSGTELRRPARVVLSDEAPSNSDEASSESEQGEIQLQSKRIKGVLPASWLRIDQQAQERRRALARQRLQQRDQSPEPTELQRGIAQKIVRSYRRSDRPAQPNFAPDDAVIISDDSDQELRPIPHQGAHDPKGAADDASALAAIFDNRYADLDDDLASMEHDRLHLPTLGTLGVKKKRQPKITDALGSTKGTKQTTDFARDNRLQQLASGLSRRKKQAKTRIPRSASPPALSVMDVELPPNAPQFLKLARRAARRDVNLARQSPRNKRIRLHTEKDTEEAIATLQQWQQGSLQPKSIPLSSYPRSRRPPLANATENRQITRGLKSPDASGWKTNTDTVPIITYPQPRMRKVKAPALQMLQRSSAALDKPARSKKKARPFPTLEKQARYVPIVPRAAQLEGDAKKLGPESRKIAFQRGLQSAGLQFDNDPAFRQRDVNPQLARFLADDDVVLPPLPTARDIGESGEQGSREVGIVDVVPKSKKRLKRKPQAKRLDVDTREYRQPSEPSFQPPSDTSPANPILIPAESTPLVQAREVLLGLWPSGARYPVTFDITPLKSDTYFHANTFVGSEDFLRALSVGKIGAREMDENAGYCTISHDSVSIRCGPWTEEMFSRLKKTITGIFMPKDAYSDIERSQRPLPKQFTAVSEVLRKLISYVSDYLSFSDPIDRQNFTANMCAFLHNLFDSIETMRAAGCGGQISPEEMPSLLHVLKYLLVLSAQVYGIAQQTSAVDFDKAKILELIKNVAQHIIKEVIGQKKDLYNFHERNRLHKERENGIQEHDVLVESIVVCIHTLSSINAPRMGFWDMVSQELSLPSSATDQVHILESVWATVFSLLPFEEFDVSGIPDRSRQKAFDKDNWGCLNDVLKRVLGLYDATSRQPGTSINEYVRINLMRCYILINDWNWKRPDQVLSTVFDFFGKHGLRPLRHETAFGSADFLQRFTFAESLTLSQNESSFHLALKVLATGLHGMACIYPEKKIRSFVFRHIPNHGRMYPKDQSLTEESLVALRNHHDLLATLYCAAPPSCRPKLDHIRDLVSHESSHREACRISVRAWANLATFQVSTSEPYAAVRPIALWYKDMLHQTLMQYRLAKTEAEDYLKSGALHESNEMVAAMVKQTMERNQSQVIATLRDSISGMKHAVQNGKDHTTLAAFLVDSSFISLLELPHLDDHRLLSVIRDTLAVLREFVSMRSVQVKHQVSQPKSEESQDYGDFPDLDDLEDVEMVDADQGVQNATVPRSSTLDFVQGSLWHLMSNAFGADHLSDDNLLLDCVDTWAFVAQAQVSSGVKQWSHYLESFSPVSWQQLRPTEQTRKFRPYFMAALISRDRAAYGEHQFEFLTALLLCLADRESLLRFQHRLLDAVVRTDEDNPLLRNLPFFRGANRDGFDITADTLRTRRLALISSLLSNMRDDLYATTIQEPRRVPELKRTYAAMLKEFMLRLKSNYQLLQQGDTVTGAYVEFVQKIVQFLKQYTSDICPVLPFFTDSIAFPLPSMDPTYVVARLCGYAPKAKDTGTAKQLSFFIQTVVQQAAADGQQTYLVNQLRTALCTEEAPVTDRVALRMVLLQDIFPAYIEEAFASRIGHLLAHPILQCLPLAIDAMIHDLRVNQIESLSTAIGTIILLAHAFIRGTEHLKGDILLFTKPSTLNGLTYMFEVATSIMRLLDYIIGRTMETTGCSRPPLVTYFAEFGTYVLQMIGDEVPQQLPSYRGETAANLANAQSADILTFCASGLRSSIKSNWSDEEGSVFFGQGQVKKEVLYDLGSIGVEQARLLDALQKFRNALVELSDEEPAVHDVVDDLVV